MAADRPRESHRAGSPALVVATTVVVLLTVAALVVAWFLLREPNLAPVPIPSASL